jgi:uncharacterized protein YgbK (DUF1537 family)
MAADTGTTGVATLKGSAFEALELPRPYADATVREQVRKALEAGPVKLAVIDDDPTGTQAVRGVPLVTRWDEPELEWAMRAAAPTFAVLANTRALPQEQAVAINAQIGERLPAVARRLGVELRAISRSDSTLRGHFPAEPEALADGLAHGGQPVDAIVLCPAFPEAGRVTAGDVHWVRRDGRHVPVAETDYAQDAAFGFRSSDLGDWVRERAGADATVASLTLADVREGGPERVAERLLAARDTARYIVANAVEATDLDVLALGLTFAERAGMRVVCRTGPSFLAARAGSATAAPLDARELALPDGRGLLVVGSHTELTNAQLREACRRHPLTVTTLDVEALLAAEGEARDALVAGVAAELRAALAQGDAALVTSRRSAHVRRGASSLATTAAIADALVTVVRAVVRELPLGWLVAKGGITSHDMATHALGATRATVLGQLFPGQVSVWELGEGSVRPGIRYVVFPGNVGDEQTLALALERLRGKA